MGCNLLILRSNRGTKRAFSILLKSSSTFPAAALGSPCRPATEQLALEIPSALKRNANLDLDILSGKTLEIFSLADNAIESGDGFPRRS